MNHQQLIQVARYSWAQLISSHQPIGRQVLIRGFDCAAAISLIDLINGAHETEALLTIGWVEQLNFITTHIVAQIFIILTHHSNRKPTMRYVFLDTETTGLSPSTGHKIVEIGAVEMIDRQFTGKAFHHYLNPQRDSDCGALSVHGLTTEFLREKPLFESIALDLLVFLNGAKVMIHNAPFDVRFIEAELSALGVSGLNTSSVVDTLSLAKKKYPNQRNNLDALCERLGVNNSQRKMHSALSDATLLAHVYLAMTQD